MKILVLCANGIATSILMKEVIKKAFEELNYKGELEIDHGSIKDRSPIDEDVDLIFCAKNFEDSFEKEIESGIKVIGLQNILSTDEAKEKIIEHSLNK